MARIRFECPGTNPFNHMNKIRFLALCLFCVLSATGVCGRPPDYYIPPTSAALKLSASLQAVQNQIISATTNHTSTSTNIIVTRKWSTTNDVLATADILNLLTNSFATSFPAGAQLSVNGNRFFVLDKTGTNILLDVSSVFSITLGGRLENTLTTRITTKTNGGSTISGNTTADLVSTATITYDDSSRSTADGTHTSFQIHGIWDTKLSENLATIFSTAQFTFTGSGDGNLRGHYMVLDSQITGKGSGQPAG